MTDEEKPEGDPRSAAKRWVRWQKAVHTATTEDRRLSILERAEREQRIAREYHSPVAVWVGLIVVLLLALGGWFLIDAMQCDPFYSDSGLARSRACR